MISLELNLHGDGAWPDVTPETMVRAERMRVAGLAAGMTSGLPSVAFCFTLPDGKHVFAETSLRLFLTAADGLKARYGDPRHEGP